MNNRTVRLNIFHSKKISALIVLVAASFGPGAAHAKTVTATGKAVVYFTLTDLAPDDGIAASYTLANPRWRDGQIIGGTEAGILFNEQNSGVETLSYSGTWGNNSGAASLSERLFESSMATMTATASLTDPKVTADYMAVVANFGATGILSPHTSITFHIDYELSAAGDWQAGRTSASVEANSGLYDLEPVEISLSDGAKTGSMTYTYANVTDMNVQKSLDVALYTFAAPVPEPSTYGMILAGLGVLALTARRRNTA